MFPTRRSRNARFRPRMSKPKQSSNALPVLSLEIDGVEWLSTDANGAPRLSSGLCRGEGAHALAEAARATVRAAGEVPGRCVLALGSGLVKQKLVTLPALTRGETRSTLARKAAGLWDSSIDDVAFHALSVSAANALPDQKGNRPDARWLVAAVKRRETQELRLALWKAGFRVVRVVSSQLSCLARARALSSENNAACIVVSALRRSVGIVLVQGDGIVNENVLEGDLRTQPAIAMSLVQEIKSFDASWRKANRGGAVGQVVLIGLPHDRAPLFKSAVQTALPTTVVTLPQELQAAETEANLGDPSLDFGRIEALDACRETGVFQLDITTPIPLQPKVAAAVLGSILVTLACLATVAYRPARGAELRELAQLAESNARTSELETLRATNADNARAVQKFQALCARNDKVLSSGWSLREVTTEMLRALRGDAALLTLELGAFERGGIQALAVTSPNPAVAMVKVDAIVHALEASPSFTGVTALPSGGIPNGTQPIAFDVKCELEVHP